MAIDEARVALRRETHAVNDVLDALADRLETFDDQATVCVRRARTALFEAWTYLCSPPEEDEDD